MAEDTAHAATHTEQADRLTGAKWPRTPQMQHSTPNKHTVEQEPNGAGHGTQDTTQRARTQLIRSQVTQDTKHATSHTDKHTREQERSGAGHCTRNTTHGASTAVNRRQVAQDTAHATKRSERAHR